MILIGALQDTLEEKIFEKSRARQLGKIKNVHHVMRPGLKCWLHESKHKKEALKALLFFLSWLILVWKNESLVPRAFLKKKKKKTVHF